jgi:membrane-associated protease RseP (regulator of RpoE activity)
MVGSAQLIDDPGTKHPGNEPYGYDVAKVSAVLWITVFFMFVFFWLLVFLGGMNLLP